MAGTVPPEGLDELRRLVDLAVDDGVGLVVFLWEAPRGAAYDATLKVAIDRPREGAREDRGRSERRPAPRRHEEPEPDPEDVIELERGEEDS